eukprot:TRINITY_DN6489_c0_g1_i1.p1 TRINITY_DN6489_c0_g1~~TRINITY_DN6489_c0_g1_i1.p1  ORF type:complete len:444 (-),score=81.74 TRINITY_DN6489_c0_g1_i1:27-1358(-)
MEEHKGDLYVLGLVEETLRHVLQRCVSVNTQDDTAVGSGKEAEEDESTWWISCLPVLACEALLQEEQAEGTGGSGASGGVDGESEEMKALETLWQRTDEAEADTLLEPDSRYAYYCTVNAIDYSSEEVRKYVSARHVLRKKLQPSYAAQIQQHAASQAADGKPKPKPKPKTKPQQGPPLPAEVTPDTPKPDPFTIGAVPSRPYYKEIAKVLYQWEKQDKFPLEFKPMIGQHLIALVDHITPMHDLHANVVRTMALLRSKSTATQPSEDGSSAAGSSNKTATTTIPTPDEECQKALAQILQLMNTRGMLTCLRLRQTFKSAERFPPSHLQLVRSFNKRHAERSGALLTVGARALAKHAHRDTTDSWWGVCSGTEKYKNEHANGLLSKLLQNAVWLNIHMLPHDLAFLEVRVAEGYGARWSADGSEFRGFLEPQMEGGHDKGWVH